MKPLFNFLAESINDFEHSSNYACYMILESVKVATSKEDIDTLLTNINKALRDSIEYLEEDGKQNISKYLSELLKKYKMK